MADNDVDVWGAHGVAVQAVTVEMMRERGKLLTLDEVHKQLSTTEPVSSVGFSVGEQVRFDLMPTWNHGIETKAGTDLVDATCKIGKVEYTLTKDAVLEATSICGLPKGYSMRTPARLIEPQLNYWFREGLSGKDLKLLAVGNRGEAVTRATIQPFSNLRLLEQAVDGIHKKYGNDAEIFADRKFQHSLRKTHLRLVVPEATRAIVSARAKAGVDDNWSIGINLQNSLIGEEATQLDGYLFAWLCTNGAIDVSRSSGAWSRRGKGQGDEVYEWARGAVDEILGGLEHTLDSVQALTEVTLEGEAEEVSNTLRDVFNTYRVPSTARERIIENMVNSDDMSMYGVMQAITMAANSGDIPAEQIDTLLRIGGEMPVHASDRCNECRRIKLN